MKIAFAPRFEALQLEEIGDRILLIRLNRPAASNALTTTMGHELLGVFQTIESNPESYGCVILTGAGERAFCGGADLKERLGMDDTKYQQQHQLFERMIRAMTFCLTPLICAANGAAVAGGLELLLACDFAYASKSAVFGLPEVTRGIMPGGGGTQQLPRAIGARRAKEVIFTGGRFTAEQALAWGVVNRLCEPAGLLKETIETAHMICRNAPLSIGQAKKAIDLGADTDLRTGLFVEIEAYNRLISTVDRREGIRAFNEKRPPDFKGR
ncbi:MAG: enoyl-CoA hydratase-related protein [Dongiaceae bacterium]